MSIPKKVFFFWGNDTLSWMRFLTLRSFRILNPDWEMTLYTAKCTGNKKTWSEKAAQDFFAYEGKNYFYKVRDLNIEVRDWKMTGLQVEGASHLSNFLKWHKLNAHGGIYSDMDILWVRPFDALYRQMQDFDAAICSTQFFSIGLLGSSINNVMFEDFYNNARKNYTPKRYQCVGVENIYNLLYQEKAFGAKNDVNWNFLTQRHIFQDLCDRYPDQKIFNIPFTAVYPFWSADVHKIFEAKYRLPKGVVGLHWYAGHPVSQRWNGLLNERTVKQHKNTFTKAARRYA